MTHEEKRAWIMLAVSAVAYATYTVIVIGGAGGGPLVDAPYAAALWWTTGGAIAAAIALEIGIGLLSPREPRTKDARDREIGRFGEHVGQSFVIVGAVAAMLMATAGWDLFWIANVIYLCFALSAVVGSTAKVVMYRTGLPQW